MKCDHFVFGLLLLMAAACTVEEPFSPERRRDSVREGDVFHAVIDDGTSTRTFIDAGLNILWNKNDHITIYDDITLAADAIFQGDDDDPSGDFKVVEVEKEEGSYSAGTDLGGDLYAIYPHSKDTRIVQDGTITYTFPEVQTFHREKSFGLGANVMVAKASSVKPILRFKNAMGWLSLRLWAETEVHVSSIILEANGGEPISGKGMIRVEDGIPMVSMIESNSSNKIRLYCEDVLLGNSETNYTEFWFALPPVALSAEKGGFKITVTTTDGGVFKQSAPIDITISRKTVERMVPLKVVPVYGTTDDMGIESISSDRGGKTYSAKEEEDGSFTLTIPTVTDFSQLKVNYSLKRSDDVLMVGGKEIISGETPIDASQKPTSLVVRRGEVEKTYKLIAQNTGLPVVRITTVGDGFTLDKLESYKNSLQRSDKVDEREFLPTKAQKESGWGVSVRIEYPNGDPGIENYEVETKIKGRGNYTWLYPKKPYALKFDKKRAVLGMAKHNRWILLANWRDRTLLRNDAAFWLSKQTDLEYTVDGQFVELEFNGVHRGNYYLCEQIKLNRVPGMVPLEWDEDDNGVPIIPEDFDYTGGYLMEIDSYYDEVNKFNDTPLQLKYMFKEPDGDDKALPDVIFNYMRDFIVDFETELKKTSNTYQGYRNYLDEYSAIMFMLLNELTENKDFFQSASSTYGPHSTYLYKKYEKDGGLLYMGPIWDFDYKTFIPASKIEGSTKWIGFDRSGYYYYFLCKDKEFRKKVRDIWNDNESAFLGLGSYIRGKARDISLSQEFDDKMWPYIGKTQEAWQHDGWTHQNDNYDYELPFNDGTASSAIETMISSFEARVTWMHNKLNGSTFIDNGSFN